MRPVFLLATALSCCLLFTDPTPAFGKSPATAGILSFVLPGAGQIYNDQVGKGVTLLGIYGSAATAALIYGPWSWDSGSSGYYGSFREKTSTLTKVMWGGTAAIAVGTLIYAVADAVGTANRVNRGGLTIRPLLSPDVKGVSVAFTF